MLHSLYIPLIIGQHYGCNYRHTLAHHSGIHSKSPVAAAGRSIERDIRNDNNECSIDRLIKRHTLVVAADSGTSVRFSARDIDRDGTLHGWSTSSGMMQRDQEDTIIPDEGA